MKTLYERISPYLAKTYGKEIDMPELGMMP